MQIIEQISQYWSFLNILLSIAIIFLNRARPARSTTLWLMMMALFPVFGFIPYLLLGRDRRRRKMFQEKESLDTKTLRNVLNQWQNLEKELPGEDQERFRDYLELVNLNMRTGRNELSGDNEVQVFTDGKEKFAQLIEDLNHAKNSIDLQYYILKSDGIGMQVIQALIAAAKRGVTVRVLTDGIGGRFFSRKAKQEMQEAGIQFGVFFPSFLRIINLRMNYRNHRKIVTIDNQVGYIGGFNVGDDYLGRYKKFGYWRDTHLRIRGSAVEDLQIRFLQDWNYVTKDNLKLDAKVVRPSKAYGNAFCQLVSSGPDTTLENIKFSILKMIFSANHVIYIQTPYFIPDQSVSDALIIAIKQGVEVNLMIPDRPDHPIVYPATLSFAGALIEAGANVYRYDNGFLHSKVVLIDDYVSLVGSCNLDERSFMLNFEASELVYSREISQKLREAFLKDTEHATLLTKEVYANRSLLMKIKEPLCRLFAPLL